MKKKIPQESKKTEEKNPQKFSDYDVARTCVMDVFQHTPIWFVRERERERERGMGYMQQISIVIF